MDKKFFMISLGCAKNLVDSEQMLSRLMSGGWTLCEDPDEADIGIINTCAFIEDAKREAIENILELSKCKDTGAMIALVVTGCMAERYKDDILEEIPEVDAVLGTGAYDQIVSVCDKLIADAENGVMQKLSRYGDINAPILECPRVQTTPFFYSYIKIAEGCDNHCAYCVIPSLRGCYRSRTEEAILEEARALAAAGVKELIVVAQDITRYGIDLCGQYRLPMLLKALCAIDGIEWIRLHYLYPDEMSDELIEVIASEEKILKYIDIPIQHASDALLASMNRRYTRNELEALIKKLRKSIPGLVLRTSVIVGLPGETKAQFAELCDFISKIKIERVGVFTYSQEEGTVAGEMENQIDDEEKVRRQETLLNVQSRVMDKYNASRMGKVYDVLCEGYDRAAGCFFGRSYAESPDIDGKIFFMPCEPRPQPGEILKVKITEDLEGDLLGEAVERTVTVDD